MKIEETDDGIRNFEGKIIDVTKQGDEESEYGPQWRIMIEPVNKDWKNQRIYLGEPETMTDESVPDSSVMAEYLEKIAGLMPGSKRKHMKGVSPSEFLLKLKGKVFQFEDKVPQNGQKERLYPVDFIEDDSLVEDEGAVE